MSKTVEFNDYTVFGREIDGISYTVEIEAGKPVYNEGNFSGLKDFVLNAADALGGEVARSGSLNENTLEHFGKDTNPSITLNEDDFNVKISGSGVGGQFLFKFEDLTSAEEFADFSNDLLGKDPSLTKIYEVSTGTNGGANRIQIFSNDEIIGLNEDLDGPSIRVADSFIFKWSGQGVGGTQTTDDFDEFVEAMGELFDGTQKRDGTMTGQFNQDQARLIGEDLDIVKIGGKGVGGNEEWEFDSQEEAQNFLDFFDNIIDAI